MRRPPATAPVPAAPQARAGRAGRAALWLLVGLLLGAAAVTAVRALGYDVERLWSRAPAVAGPRTWVVGLEPSSDFSNIGEALAKAAPGDTVTVGPGEYREAVSLKTGVVLLGSRDSVLMPPVGAGGGWTAVTATQVTDARLSGFAIAAGPGQPLAVGLRVDDSTMEVDGLEISGATQAAIDLRAGARVTLRHCLVRNNDGIGVLVRAKAEPRLERNVIIHNGLGPQKHAAVVIEPGASPLLVDNGIGGNGGDAVQGWPSDTLPTLMQENVLTPAPVVARPRPRPGAGRE